jgi:hypothetical protein
MKRSPETMTLHDAASIEERVMNHLSGCNGLVLQIEEHV